MQKGITARRPVHQVKINESIILMPSTGQRERHEDRTTQVMPLSQCPRAQAVTDESVHQRAAVHAVRDEHVHEPAVLVLVFEVLEGCEQPVRAVPCGGCGRGEVGAADDLVVRR